MDTDVQFCCEPFQALDSTYAYGYANDGVTNGQAAVLRACLEQHYAQLQRSLAFRVGCTDLATECLHETWLRLEYAPPGGPVRDPLAYLYRVAYRLAIDQIRSGLAGRGPDDCDALLTALADPAPGPDAIVQARSDARELERALQQLPYRHGCVLYALRVEEKTRQEVADWLSISVRNVDTMLRQTYETLAARREASRTQASLACLAYEAGRKQAWQAPRDPQAR